LTITSYGNLKEQRQIPLQPKCTNTDKCWWQKFQYFLIRLLNSKR